MTRVRIAQNLQPTPPKRLYDVFLLPTHRMESRTLLRVLLMESQEQAEEYAKVYSDRGQIEVQPTKKSDYPPSQKHLLKNL